jgi:hypothetical protein
VRPGWLTVLSAAAALVGCSLVIDTGSLANGDDVASGGSGASEAGSDSTPPDTSAEATADASNDTSSDTANDTSSDAFDGNSGDAADAGTFCEGLLPTPTLCSDFDGVNLPAGWDSVVQWGPCTGVVDTLGFKSPPRSFVAKAPALSGTDQCETALARTFAAPKSSIVIEFDVFPAAMDSSRWLYLAPVVMNAQGGSDDLSLRWMGTTGEVNEAVTLDDGGMLYEKHGAAEVPALGQWSHVRWEMTFTGATAFSSLTVNGKNTGGTLHSKDFLASADVQLGITFVAGPSSAWEIRFDNVVVDIQ